MARLHLKLQTVIIHERFKTLSNSEKNFTHNHGLSWLRKFKECFIVELENVASRDGKTVFMENFQTERPL